jgi:hypothetical protein
MSATTPETTPETTPVPVELTQEQVKKVLDTQVQVKVVLLKQITNIIEHAQRKGAFEMKEVEGVQSVWKTITDGIDEVTKQVSSGSSTTSEELDPIPEST